MQAVFHKALLIRWRPAAAAAVTAAAMAGVSAWYAWPTAKDRAGVGVTDYAQQEHCMEAALLVHDVRWAATCMQLSHEGQGDGIADCELPDPRAGQLYALLQEAEQRCVAESRQSPRS